MSNNSRSNSVTRMQIAIPSTADVRRAAEIRRENFPRIQEEIFREAPKPRVQSTAQRMAVQRRLAQPIPRRQELGLPITRPPSGRFNRATKTPEQRTATRRQNLRSGRLGSPIRDILSTDIGEPRASRTKIDRVIIPEKFPCVREYIVNVTKDISKDYGRSLQAVLNNTRGALYRRLIDLPEGRQFKAWISITSIFSDLKLDGKATFQKYDIHFNDNTTVFSRRDIDEFIGKIQGRISNPLSSFTSASQSGSQLRFVEMTSAKIGTGSF